MSKARDGHYQLACAAAFEGVHRVPEMDVGISAPLQYYAGAGGGEEGSGWGGVVFPPFPTADSQADTVKESIRQKGKLPYSNAWGQGVGMDGASACTRFSEPALMKPPPHLPRLRPLICREPAHLCGARVGGGAGRGGGGDRGGGGCRHGRHGSGCGRGPGGGGGG